MIETLRGKIGNGLGALLIGTGLVGCATTGEPWTDRQRASGNNFLGELFHAAAPYQKTPRAAAGAHAIGNMYQFEAQVDAQKEIAREGRTQINVNVGQQGSGRTGYHVTTPINRMPSTKSYIFNDIDGDQRPDTFEMTNNFSTEDRIELFLHVNNYPTNTPFHLEVKDMEGNTIDTINERVPGPSGHYILSTWNLPTPGNYSVTWRANGEIVETDLIEVKR